VVSRLDVRHINMPWAADNLADDPCIFIRSETPQQQNVSQLDQIISSVTDARLQLAYL
jgi:hypothetical protein